MPMLDGSWSPTIRRIGELERSDHYYLTADDTCYFFGEYSAREGYNHSSTNQIIFNIKKKPSTRNTPQWQYKVKDMRRIASAIAGAIRADALPNVAFVPIPPSKLRTHPEYDCRMTTIAKAISPQADVRELLETVRERPAAHESQQRLRPDELADYLKVQVALLQPRPTEIILIDDVITTGCGYVTCRKLLQDHLPGVPITGVFAARRVPPKIDFGDIDF